MIESQPRDSISLTLNFSSYFYNYNLLLSWFAGPEPPAPLRQTALQVGLSRNYSEPGNIISNASSQ